MKATKKADKGSHRLYEKGRSTKGWIRGQQIENILQVSVGDVFVAVEHKQQSESLIQVIATQLESFSYQYVSHALNVKKGDDQPKLKNISDLPFNECYRAISLKAARKAA